MIADRLRALVDELLASQIPGNMRIADRLEQILAEDASGWRPIGPEHQNGWTWLVCIQGVAGSTGEAIWRNGAWRTMDRANPGMTYYATPPTHARPLPEPPPQEPRP